MTPTYYLCPVKVQLVVVVPKTIFSLMESMVLVTESMVPLPLTLYCFPQLSVNVWAGIESVFPLAVMVSVTGKTQLPVPTEVPVVIRVFTSYPRLRTRFVVLDGLQLEVQAHVPWNLAASLRVLVLFFLSHPAITSIIASAATGKNFICLKLYDRLADIFLLWGNVKVSIKSRFKIRGFLKAARHF